MQNPPLEEYLIALLVEDHPGVTMKIAGMFARRGHNIVSFTGAPIERKGFSRIILKVIGTENNIEQIQKQMNKLIEVVKVQVLRTENSISRELALIKLSIKDENAHQTLLSYIDIYQGSVIDINLKYITLQLTGTSDKIDSFIELVKNMNVLKELSRSGNVALYRGSDTVLVQ